MKVNVNESKCKFNYTKREKNELYDFFFFLILKNTWDLTIRKLLKCCIQVLKIIYQIVVLLDELSALFRMGFFGAAHGWGGEAKRPPPPIPKVCYSYLTMMKLGYTLNSYTLPKQVPKTIWITWHTTWVLLTLTFFYRKSQILLYQERQI